MANNQDVIVFDNEFIWAAKEIDSYCSALIELIDSFSDSINDILENAIKDEAITQKLSSILLQVKGTKSVIKDVGSEVNTICKNYISEIDKTDDFLY